MATMKEEKMECHMEGKENKEANSAGMECGGQEGESWDRLAELH